MPVDPVVLEKIEPGVEGVPPEAQQPRLTTNQLPRGVARYHGGTEPQVTPSCNSPKLTYFGGPLLQSPVIVPVFWNGNVNSALTAPTTGLPQFYADVTQSSYWQWLQEYDSVGLSPGTNQAILPGTATAGVTLTPSHCPTSASSATCKLTDAQLQTELAAQITAGVLPAPVVDCTGNPQTIYMVSFPPHVSLTGPDGAGTSCVQFCAYHSTGTYGAAKTPLIYAALMDEFTGGCATGCGGNATGLENSTDTASHELAEAATDADIGLDTANGYANPAAWGDNSNNCGEIGDICDTGSVGDTITVSGRSWVVQELWSNKQGKCTSTGTPLPVCSGTNLTGCRKCSCGDDGNACNGSTPVCETTSTNVLFGACEQCTATSGTCPSPQTCAQSSTPAQDDICTGCTPATSCPAGDNCGNVANGCGGLLSCGTCAAPQTCGGAGTPNVCGCTPATTCPAGDSCGTVPDGCGGVVVCGPACTAPQTCGGGGVANVCGCTPATTCAAGLNCGVAGDGCGGTLSCGTCASTQTCVGNQCVANAFDAGTSVDAGADSGTPSDAGTSADAGSIADSGPRGEAGADSGTSGHDAGAADDAGALADSGSTGEADSGLAEDGAVATTDSGAAVDAESDAAADAGSLPGDNSGGCGCHKGGAAEAGPSATLMALGALALLGGLRVRRRTRRHDRPRP